MTGHLSRPIHMAVAAVTIALVALVAGNVFLSIKIMSALTEFSSLRQRDTSLPCPAIPTRLILEDPACAQKLLNAMNVTSVRVREGKRNVSVPGNL